MTGDLLSSYQAMLWAAEFSIKTAITGVRVVSNGLGYTQAGFQRRSAWHGNGHLGLGTCVPIPIIAKLAQYVSYLVNATSG